MPFSGGTVVNVGTVNIAEPITVDGAVETDHKITTVTLTIAQGAAISDAFDFRDYGGGIIIMPAEWTAADIGAQVCDTVGGTYAPLKDASNAYGTDVSVDGPVAATCYPIPPWWFAAAFVKLWSHNGSGTNTNQAAARTVKVMLKS